MSRALVLEQLKDGSTLSDLLRSLAGQNLDMRVHPYCAPYLDHKVAGHVDGPPSSRVVAVVSGADPNSQSWRRFTISRTGEGQYEMGVFPTAFHNANAPLAPGIPPSTSRHQG